MLSVTLILAATLQVGDYPRIGNLWGCSPGMTDYDKWGKYDLLVTAGGTLEEVRRFRREVESRNPGVVLLGTGPLMNIGAPAATAWMEDEWYMHRPDGSLITWWADQVYTPNILIDECLAALIAQTAAAYGGALSEGALDGMFYDSVVGRASWLGQVDTNGDGKADLPAEVDPKWHDAQCAFFDALRERWPNIRILANDVDEGHRPHVNGRLFEGGPLLDRVANGSLSVDAAISTLEGWTSGSRQPAITFAIMTHPVGWQGFRVGRGDRVTTPGEIDRVSRDFGRMRLGLLISLMTDVFYAYDLGTVWYGLPFWYAEYDAPLGKALGPACQVHGAPPVTILDWKAGEPARGLELGDHAYAGPDGITGTVTDVAAGWRRLFRTDPRTVRFEPGRSYEIEAVCEVLTQPSGTLQFNLRTAEGGWELHDKGVEQNRGEDGSEWRIRTIVVPDDFNDYSAEWHLNGAGALRLKSLRVSLVNESYWMREFEGGVALLNRLSTPIEVKLDAPMRRLKDDACPLHIIECDDSDASFAARGAWEVLGGEGAFCGTSYRVARKPGEVAAWRVTAPSTDRYAVFACSPKLEGLTDAAQYTVTSGGAAATAVLDQRYGDGGWVKLFDIDLREGDACEVTLQSGGAGITVADAVRLESAARLNDGALIESVVLPPLDGALLLRDGEVRRIPVTETDEARGDVIEYSTPDEAAAAKPQWLRDRLEWFQDLKFGVILHWGPYCQWDCCESWPLVPADAWARGDGVACWVERGRDLERFQREYWDLNRTFNPTEFDPGVWADVAKAAGARYVVFTTKHHDGFCLWDTATTDYRVTHPDCPFSTHPRANIVREVFDAFRSRGLRIGCYFSKSDWHSPHYWSRDLPFVDRNPNYDTRANPELWAKFVDYVHSQVKELMSDYGPIDILWLDGGQVRPPEQDIDMPRLASMARELQPGLIIVDRTVGGDYEDYITPEHVIPDEPLPVPWESCLTLGNGWKHSPGKMTYRPTTQVLRELVDIVSKGGNLLLGVGPTAAGTFDEGSTRALQEIGKWMDVNGEAIYGTRPIAPYREGDVYFTSRGDTVYAIAFVGDERQVRLHAPRPAPGATVSLLGFAEPLTWRTEGDCAVIELPARLPTEHAVSLAYKLSL